MHSNTHTFTSDWLVPSCLLLPYMYMSLNCHKAVRMWQEVTQAASCVSQRGRQQLSFVPILDCEFTRVSSSWVKETGDKTKYMEGRGMESLHEHRTRCSV